MDLNGVNLPGSLRFPVFGAPCVRILRLRLEKLEAGRGFRASLNVRVFFVNSLTGGAFCLPEGKAELFWQLSVAEFPGSMRDKADPGLPGGRVVPYGAKVVKELPGFDGDGFAKGGGTSSEASNGGSERRVNWLLSQFYALEREPSSPVTGRIAQGRLRLATRSPGLSPGGIQTGNPP